MSGPQRGGIMARRCVAMLATAAGGLALGQGVAGGCGDRVVLLGGGARVNRSKYPSRVLVYMNPVSRVPAAEKEFHIEGTLTAAGHKAKVVESQSEVQKALESGKYDLVLADVADAPDLRKRCEASPSKPAIVPLLYKPTAAEISAA